jgi:hypothetical protein
MKTGVKFISVICICFLLAICICFLLASCAHFGEAPPSKVCPPPEGQESWLCEKSAELDITLEQVYGWIYTPVATGVVFDKLDRQEICDFDSEISDWYIRNYPFSYDRLIMEIFTQLKAIDDPMKLALLSNIINRNLNLYSSPELIKAYDDQLIRAGNNQFRMDFYCD